MPFSYRCLACGARELAERMLICEQCGAENMVVRDEPEAVEEVEEQEPRRRAVNAAEITTRLPPVVSTGRAAWDTALGGGFARPSSVLIFGPPGVGKTTSVLRILCHVAKTLNGVALYGSAEMPAQHLRALASKVGISTQDLKRLYIQDSPDAEDMRTDVVEFAPVITAWDSIQRFRVEGEMGEVALRSVVTGAIELGASQRAITLLISQVTKDDGFVGERGIAHDVDVELSLRKAGEGLVGVDCSEKNRFAPTPAGAIERLY